jgi:hypothetical protein
MGIVTKYLPRDEESRLLTRTHYRSHPILYVTAEGRALCSGCAQHQDEVERVEPIAWTINTDPIIYCSRCEQRIESLGEGE